jgi:hypothetical protein
MPAGAVESRPAIRLVRRALPSVAVGILLEAFAERTSDNASYMRDRMGSVAEPFVTVEHEAVLLRLYQDPTYGESRITVAWLLAHVDTPASRGQAIAVRARGSALRYT